MLNSTRFNRADNWSARLHVARDIFAEVRAEASQLQAEASAVDAEAALQADIYASRVAIRERVEASAVPVDVEQMSFEELEALTRPEVSK